MTAQQLSASVVFEIIVPAHPGGGGGGGLGCLWCLRISLTEEGGKISGAANTTLETRMLSGSTVRSCIVCGGGFVASVWMVDRW